MLLLVDNGIGHEHPGECPTVIPLANGRLEEQLFRALYHFRCDLSKEFGEIQRKGASRALQVLRLSPLRFLYAPGTLEFGFCPRSSESVNGISFPRFLRHFR